MTRTARMSCTASACVRGDVPGWMRALRVACAAEQPAARHVAPAGIRWNSRWQQVDLFAAAGVVARGLRRAPVVEAGGSTLLHVGDGSCSR
ncbi:MAG: hypothetical protein AVDCRST_MAG71-412 [uncultured Lysobacter sp.]|uniref:Uncharacterized protein n=1 Tax=uncultured Lysobacter sp. TaxID=271060 RepID=A0A6J4KHC9_9GAMM|nr:MAG: hypothetical protein AVDCRST_MAG71-412 [uncultured Lysobacter sp.]